MAANAVLVAAGVTASGAQTGTIRGHVVAADNRLPLPYSVVSLAGRTGERFTTDSGEFIVANVPAGDVHVRVRHIGYQPSDVVVHVTAGATATVTVPLTHAVLHLDAVEVSADRRCTAPGAPSAAVDPGLAAVFQQVVQNGAQYQLISTTYPFESKFERKIFAKDDTLLTLASWDTIAVRSDDPWRYAPGRIVTRSRGQTGGWLIVVPTIAVFADSTFIANHCFWNGGQEHLDGQPVIRVDFRVADGIRQPDYNGSLYLDSASLVIRRSVIELSRAPGHGLRIDRTSIDTRFAETLPSVPMISDIRGLSHTAMREPVGNVQVNEKLEQQHLIAVSFLDQMPGAPDRPPPTAAIAMR